MINYGWNTTIKQKLTGFWHRLLGPGGSRTVPIVCSVLLLLLGFLLGRIDQDSNVDSAENRQRRAINLARILEEENRKLKEALQTEQLKRNLSEKNLKALAEQMEATSSSLVTGQKEITFLKQLLQERDNLDTEVQIRNLSISPDFRENSYNLQAVLIRNASNQRSNFKGRFELAINVDVKGKATIAYHPERGQRTPSMDFRFYHEINDSFLLPPGAEVLNARLSIYNSNDDLVVSRILIEANSLGSDETETNAAKTEQS